VTAANAEQIGPRPSFLARVLRTILRALLIAFAVGLAIGTVIRCAAERNATPALQYLGEREKPVEPAASARAA
jgi:hypothetical protein